MMEKRRIRLQSLENSPETQKIWENGKNLYKSPYVTDKGQ